MKKYSSLNTIAHVALNIVVVMVLFLLLVGAWHAQANVEDLELAIGPKAIGKWKAFLHLATTYDGRFSTNFLHGFNPLVWGSVKGYKLMIFIALFASFFASLWFANTWLEIKTWKTKILITSFFVASLFLLSPNLAHHLYWMGSSFVYFYPTFFFLFFVASLIRYLNASANKQLMWFLSTALILFLALGFSELFLPFYLLFFAGLLVYLFIDNREVAFKVLPLAVWCVMIIVFVLATPAVEFRFEKDPAEGAISLAVFTEAIGSYLYMLKSAFISWPSLFIIVAFVYIYSRDNAKLRFEINWKTIYWFIGAFLVIPFFMTVPFFLVKISSDEFPFRIYIPALFIQLLILCFIFIPFGLEKLKAKGISLKHVFLPISAIAVSVLLLSNIYFGKNALGLLYSDFTSGKLARFNTFMNNRYELLKLEGEKDIPYIYVCVEELVEFPASIYTHPDLENNRRMSKWNKFIEGYFKIDEVAVPGENIKKFDL